MPDKAKIITSIFLLIAGGMLYVIPSQFLPANPQTSETVRFGGMVGGILLAAFFFWFTEQRVKFFQLVKDAKVELKKVVWPTRQETTTYTITVVLFTLAVAIYNWFVDKGIEWVLYDLILQVN